MPALRCAACFSATALLCREIRVPYRYFHADDEMGVLAQYYRLPWLSVRSLVWGQIGLPEVRADGTLGEHAFVREAGRACRRGGRRGGGRGG